MALSALPILVSKPSEIRHCLPNPPRRKSGARFHIAKTQSSNSEEVDQALDAVSDDDVLVVCKLEHAGRPLFLAGISGNERPTGGSIRWR